MAGTTTMETTEGPAPGADREVTVDVGSGLALQANLLTPDAPLGLIVFAHGSGSSRHSRRNRLVATSLHAVGFGTLLLDLLTPDEEEVDVRTGRLRFDVALLGARVVAAIDWVRRSDASPIGLFGASTGAAAALIAASARPGDVSAVVSRGGRPDLAGEALPVVQAPTLLIVGGSDDVVLEMNRGAQGVMRAETSLEIVPGAGHLFEEPGALDRVAELAAGWFLRYLPR